MRRIEGPLGHGGVFGLFKSKINGAVDAEVHALGAPVDGVGVEGGFEIGDVQLIAYLGAFHVVEGIGMYGGEDRVGVVAHVLHDVDLAAAGPAHFFDILAEHPNGGPGAASAGQLGAHFDAAPVPGGAVAGDEAGARVGTLAVGLPVRLDDEVAVFLAHIVGAIGVVLQFVIAPAPPAEVVAPLGAIGGTGAVELVGPDGGGRRIGGVGNGLTSDH